MARPLRIEFPGAWYHVTSRGNERKRIFVDDKDRQKFLDILASSVETCQVQVHGYVLMENHFHLVLMTPQAGLHVFMHRLNTAYTVYFNRRHKRAGHLFQGRYKAIIIDADSHLTQVSRYVHLNPVRIRRHCRKEIGFKRKLLSDYRWSSLHGYSSVRKRQVFMTYDQVLSMVGGGDDARGRRVYGRFVLSGIAEDMSMSYWEDVRGQVVLGSDEFVNWLQERFLKTQKATAAREKVFSHYGQLLPSIEVNAVATEVAKHFEVEVDELLVKRSRHRQARRFFLALCYDFLSGRKSLSAIGADLGPVGAAALCRNRALVEKELSGDKALARKYFKIRNQLSEN
jgi:REP element-mobilizing transposase RayT